MPFLWDFIARKCDVSECIVDITEECENMFKINSNSIFSISKRKNILRRCDEFEYFGARINKEAIQMDDNVH